MIHEIKKAAGCKSLGELADKIGISRQAIHRWQYNGIPKDRIDQIVEMTSIDREKLETYHAA